MPNIFKYKEIEYLNIDATVGLDGVNNRDDVYLVQAFLYEVLTDKSFNFAVKRPPLPTGTFDAETKIALAEYKRICNQIAASTSRSDGNNKVYYINHIDPIQDSIFAFGTKVLWALARLNGEILDVMRNDSSHSVKEYMFKKYPDLIFMFR